MHLLPTTFQKLSTLSHPPPHPISTKTRALLQQGLYKEALLLSAASDHLPDKFTFPSLLKACAALSTQPHGQQLHASIITSGLHSDPFISTSLINMYVKCGSLLPAVQVFDQMSQTDCIARDITLWNSIIDGYFRFGFVSNGFDRFRRMTRVGVRPDGYSICIVLGVLSELGDGVGGKEAHGYLVRNLVGCDPFLDSGLIDMYMKCGRTMDAWRVFDGVEDKGNAVVRNVMIGGFCENGAWEKSVEFYVQTKKEKLQLGSAVFSNVLMLGKGVHCDVVKFGVESEPYVCTSLVMLYGRFMRVEDAKRVFDGIQDKGIELWNALVSAYCW